MIAWVMSARQPQPGEVRLELLLRQTEIEQHDIQLLLWAIVAKAKFEGARIATIEAQEISIRLARKSIAWNGVEDRVTPYLGDLRDAAGESGGVVADAHLDEAAQAAVGTGVHEVLEGERVGGVRAGGGHGVLSQDR